MSLDQAEFRQRGKRGKQMPVMSRFMQYVKKTDNCWLWSTQSNRQRPEFYFQGKTVKAPRMAYELFIGPIAPGMCVCHTCDMPHCVNPAHLWLGTAQQNIEDMMQKGRSSVIFRRCTLIEKGFIRIMHRAGWNRHTLARLFNCKASYVSGICCPGGGGK